MITKKKLQTLNERTRLRKIANILHQAALLANMGKSVDLPYINDILPLAGLAPIDASTPELSFLLEDLSYSLLTRLGDQPSDWDFMDQEGNLDSSARKVQDKVLVLDRIRSPYNVGAIFRSADSFGISRIVLVEGGATPDHVRARRTSMGTTDVIPWDVLPQTEVVDFLRTYDPSEVLALELGGYDINTFSFPTRGVAVLGSEEFGISAGILSCCGRRVTIPLGGSKGSLNVSVAAGILLQRWF